MIESPCPLLHRLAAPLIHLSCNSNSSMNLSSKDSVDEPEGEGRGEGLKSRLSCSSY